MKKPTKLKTTTPSPTYQDIPEWGDAGQLTRVADDFLPTPEELVETKPKLKKVTIILDEQSIKFFKNKSRDLNTSYQKMIRNLVSHYAKTMSAKGEASHL